MEITLNGEKLDVEFENEKYLGEVLSGVANWLKSDGYYLKEFCVDGKWYSPELDFAALRQDFSAIGKLELSSGAAPKADSTSSRSPKQESLQTLYDYFQHASDAFEAGRFVVLQDLFSSPEALFELLDRSLAGCDDVNASHKLRQALSEWGYFQDLELALIQSGSSQKPEQRAGEQQMRAALRDILELLEAQLALSDGSVSSDSAALKRKLSNKQVELEDVVVQLQNGQMQQCMHLVSDLSLLLEQLLQDTRENSELGGLFVQLGPFLQELATAIEETDTVAIGDLVEYEIIPLIQQIVDELD